MTTFAITNPRSGADLGTYEAATAHAAIGAMMSDAGHSVWTATSVGGDDYDAMTWDSEADAANDDGTKATTRATVNVTVAND